MAGSISALVAGLDAHRDAVHLAGNRFPSEKALRRAAARFGQADRQMVQVYVPGFEEFRTRAYDAERR